MKSNAKNKKTQGDHFTLLTLFITLIASSGYAADLSPDEGLKKLSQNIETSTKNRDEYQKVLGQVYNNINTLDSANAELSVSKKKLQQQLQENKVTLALHSKKIQEIDRNRQEEEKKKALDLQKIQQLEKTLEQLKALQITRQDRIDKLALDRSSIEKSQKEGETLQQTLAQESKTLDQRMEVIKKDLAPWKTKKKTFEKEAARWNSEIDKHQKMESEIKLLTEETT